MRRRPEGLNGGKVDRALLKTKVATTADSTGLARPEVGVESTLAHLWRVQLGHDKLGRYDNVFELGAHSLMVVQLHAQLESTFARSIPIVWLFQFPTLHSLARVLGAAEESTSKTDAAHERGNKQRQILKQKQLSGARRRAALISAVERKSQARQASDGQPDAESYPSDSEESERWM